MIKEIAKINIIGEKPLFDKVISALHSLGTVEIVSRDAINHVSTTIKQHNEQLSKIEYEIAQTNFVIKFLESEKVKLKKEKKKDTKTSIREMILKPKIKITGEKLKKLVENYNWREAASKCEKIEENINNAENTIKMLEEQIKGLLKWEGLDILSDDLAETFTTKTFLTEITNQTYSKINDILSPYPLVAYRKVRENSKNLFILITYSKEVEKQFLEHLNKNNVVRTEIPNLENTPHEEIKKINSLIKLEERKIKEEKEEIKKILKEEDEIKIISDWLNWEKIKLETSIRALRTDYVFCITAWAAKDSLNIIKEKVKAVSEKILVQEEEIEEDNSKIPVIYKNRNMAEPFEMVTEMYGAPLYNEPDPTPYLAPFFILFFALAITDAIYGIILAITALLAIKILKIPKEDQKLFRIIFYGGIVTFFVGALFGGWGGIILEKLPPWLGNPLIFIRLIDPITEPIKFLLFTFVLGIIQLISGLAISMYWKIKNGKIWDGIFDNGSWILLLSSLSFWAATAQTPIGNYFKLASIVSAVFLVLSLGRGAGNIIFQILKGLYGLYGITAYFSDMLSYSRLLALGLATGIIGMVINIIAGMSYNMIPYIGWLVAGIILIAGHLFNIGINVLGAYIHSSRLQYVEFFPKFMEGGGKAFQPFKRESRYVKIVN
ncbi:MAG: V-type ATP synthase subunit I [bacterium]